jgi:hypothetical protein
MLCYRINSVETLNNKTHHMDSLFHLVKNERIQQEAEAFISFASKIAIDTWDSMHQTTIAAKQLLDVETQQTVEKAKVSLVSLIENIVVSMNEKLKMVEYNIEPVLETQQHTVLKTTYAAEKNILKMLEQLNVPEHFTPTTMDSLHDIKQNIPTKKIHLFDKSTMNGTFKGWEKATEMAKILSVAWVDIFLNQPSDSTQELTNDIYAQKYIRKLVSYNGTSPPPPFTLAYTTLIIFFYLLTTYYYSHVQDRLSS